MKEAHFCSVGPGGITRWEMKVTEIKKKKNSVSFETESSGSQHGPTSRLCCTIEAEVLVSDSERDFSIRHVVVKDGIPT